MGDIPKIALTLSKFCEDVFYPLRLDCTIPSKSLLGQNMLPTSTAIRANVKNIGWGT